MQPGEDPFQFMMENGRLAADLRRLGNRSVTELRKCVIIVAGLSADYEIEVRILENNPTCLERAEIKRVVEKYNRLLRQQQDLKALSASKGTTTVDCGEKNRRSRNRFEGNCFNCGRKGHRAENCRSKKKKIEKSEDAPADKKGGGRESATSVGMRSTLRIYTVAYAEAWSTGLAIVSSGELRRVGCWPK